MTEHSEELLPSDNEIQRAREIVKRRAIFKTASDIHGRSIESADYRAANSEIARCYLRLVAAWNTRSDTALAEAQTRLSNLLAVIHRDGGQYEGEHGTEKTFQAAMVLSSERIGALTEALARVKVLKDALERLDRNFDLLLAGKPVRDVAETKAETRAALKGTGA